MSPTPTEITTTVSGLIAKEGGIIAFVQNVGMGGIYYALVLEIIAGIQSFGSLVMGPPRALGRGMILLIDATLGGMVDVFGAGTATTIYSFTDGTAALLGPLAQPAAVGVVMITLFVFIYAVNRMGITPWSIYGSVVRR